MALHVAYSASSMHNSSHVSSTALMSSRLFVTSSALALFIAGVVLLFDPTIIGITTTPARIVTTLYAAALIGLGFATWIARTGPMGGIYGRAIVSGNFGHAFVGTLSLLRPALATGATGMLQIVLLLYTVLALGWGYLLFWASGIPRTGTP